MGPEEMMISRRGLLLGLGALAAPAVIRTPGLLMPVRVPLHLVRYKGVAPYDAGLFYCPYAPSVLEEETAYVHVNFLDSRRRVFRRVY